MSNTKKEPAPAGTGTSSTNENITAADNYTTALQLCQEVRCILSDDIPESMDSNNRFACYLAGYAAAKMDRAVAILKESGEV